MTLLDRPGTPGNSDDNRRGGKRIATPAGAAPRGHSRIRKDIEGLRAVAMFLVLPYHAGLMLFPGGFVGVDVFFVISGFVITGQLLKEVDRDGHVSLGRFYARRAKRLLPAAGLVLVATAAMIYFLVPKIRWGNTGGDIVTSAIYFVNYHLANRSVDYLAEDVPPSPVQHYWSLSVEEQFYFVWPVLVLLVVWITARMQVRRRAEGGPAQTTARPPLFRPVLFTVIVVLALFSLVWAIYSSIASPERAYFDTTVRAWEFAAGTIVALVITRCDQMPKRVGVILTWLGLGMVLVAGLLYNKEMVWPGAAALLPIIGAAIFIAGGNAAGDSGPVKVIGVRWMVFLGSITYSLYLWHWPLLIVARERNDGAIPVWVGLIIVTLTVIPAYLTFRLVENPIRNSPFVAGSTRVAIGIGVISTLVAVVAGLMLSLAFANASSTSSTAPGDNPLLTPGTETSQAPVDTWDYGPREAPELPPQPTSYDALGDITPNPLAAEEDVPDLYAEGCQTPQDSTDVNVCTYGDDDAALTIAVVGDSKAAQWVPAMELLAPQNDWQIKTYTKSACPFVDATVTVDQGPYDECREWGQEVFDRLTGDEQPDVVLTAQARKTAMVGDDPNETSQEAMEDGMRSYWTQLEEAGVTVISLGDTPQTGERAIYACVAENLDDVSECTFDRATGVEASGVPLQKLVAEEVGIPFIDMTDFVCPVGDDCPPIVGDILVYRQGSHITKTYAESLAPVLGTAVEQAIEFVKAEG